MSKLGDAIRRTMRAEAAPMGFGAARPQPKATMLVGVLARAGTRVEGADVIVIDAPGGLPSAADVKAASEANNGAVIGVRTNKAEREALAELGKSGLGFLLFDPDSTPAAALLEDEVGFVPALPADPEESYLRSLAPLSLDAFYLDTLPSPLTVARQLELTRIGVLGQHPVIAKVPADAGKSDLECLRAAGVAVLLVEDVSKVGQLKETVLSLPPRRARKDERPSMVALPRTQPPHEHEEDDDD
jgi:hypothetical protein